MRSFFINFFCFCVATLLRDLSHNNSFDFFIYLFDSLRFHRNVYAFVIAFGPLIPILVTSFQGFFVMLKAHYSKPKTYFLLQVDVWIILQYLLNNVIMLGCSFLFKVSSSGLWGIFMGMIFKLGIVKFFGQIRQKGCRDLFHINHKDKSRIWCLPFSVIDISNEQAQL